MHNVDTQTILTLAQTVNPFWFVFGIAILAVIRGTVKAGK